MMKTYKFKGLGLEVMAEDFGIYSYNYLMVILQKKDIINEKWRLPTFKELEYLASLSRGKGHIGDTPTHFTKNPILGFRGWSITERDTWYWTGTLESKTMRILLVIPSLAKATGSLSLSHNVRLVRDI